MSFNVNQVFAMVEAGHVLDLIDDATRGHVVEYDPSEDTHPNLVSLDKFLAEEQIALRGFSVRLPEEELRIGLQRCFVEPEPEGFGQHWPLSFQSPEHAAFSKLDVIYTGQVSAGMKGSRRQESYRAYRIYQPDSLLHNLGLFVASIEVHTREIIPAPRTGVLGSAFKTATQRLFSLAANRTNVGQSKKFEQIAENAARQEYMVTDSFEPENGYQILDGNGVRRLSELIHLALVHGKAIDD